MTSPGRARGVPATALAAALRLAVVNLNCHRRCHDCHWHAGAGEPPDGGPAGRYYVTVTVTITVTSDRAVTITVTVTVALTRLPVAG